MRDGALASLKIKHVNLVASSVNQDPREVRTKNSKAQITTFFRVEGSARTIVEDTFADPLLHQELVIGVREPVRFIADSLE